MHEKILEITKKILKISIKMFWIPIYKYTKNIFDPIAKLVEKHCNVGIDPVTVFLTNGFEIFTPDFLSVILRCKHISLLAYHLLITKEILPLKSFEILAEEKFDHFTM